MPDPTTNPPKAQGDVAVTPVTPGQWYRLLGKEALFILGIVEATANVAIPELAKAGVHLPPWIGVSLIIVSRVYNIYGNHHDRKKTVRVDHSEKGAG